MGQVLCDKQTLDRVFMQPARGVPGAYARRTVNPTALKLSWSIAQVRGSGTPPDGRCVNTSAWGLPVC